MTLPVEARTVHFNAKANRR